jgi:hypothetical protein
MAESSELAEAPRHVLDVFVQSENLHRDQDNRRVRRVRRPREIDRHLSVRDLDLGLAGGEAGAVGVDRIGADRSGGKRVAGGGRRGGRQEEAAAREGIDLMRQSLDIGHQLGLGRHAKPPVAASKPCSGSVMHPTHDTLSTLPLPLYSGCAGA